MLVPLGLEQLAQRERGWGEGSKREKQELQFINNIVHPLPAPPPDPMQNADAFFKGTRGGGVKSRVATKKSGISARFLIAIRDTAPHPVR